MKISRLKNFILSIMAWFGINKRFWIMFLYEFLSIYFFPWALAIYLGYVIHHQSLLELFILGLGGLIYFSVCTGSFIVLYLMRGTRQFWLIFILFCLPAAYHLLVKSTLVLGMSFLSAYMRGGMISLNVETYKSEYDKYNQGSFSPNYARDRQVYANKKVEQAQKVHDKYLQSFEGSPTPCRLVKTPVRYWKLDLI